MTQSLDFESTLNPFQKISALIVQGNMTDIQRMHTEIMNLSRTTDSGEMTKLTNIFQEIFDKNKNTPLTEQQENCLALTFQLMIYQMRETPVKIQIEALIERNESDMSDRLHFLLEKTRYYHTRVIESKNDAVEKRLKFPSLGDLIIEYDSLHYDFEQKPEIERNEKGELQKYYADGIALTLQNSGNYIFDFSPYYLTHFDQRNPSHQSLSFFLTRLFASGLLKANATLSDEKFRSNQKVLGITNQEFGLFLTKLGFTKANIFTRIRELGLKSSLKYQFPKTRDARSKSMFFSMKISDAIHIFSMKRPLLERIAQKKK